MYEGYTTPMLKTFMETVSVNDSEDIYNGKEQTGTVITTDGMILSSNIYGNKGIDVGEYIMYSDQQGYDVVSSKAEDKSVYKIKSLQSLVVDKNEDYNAIVGMAKKSDLSRKAFGEMKMEKDQSNQVEIINNSEALIEISKAIYD